MAKEPGKIALGNMENIVAWLEQPDIAGEEKEPEKTKKYETKAIAFLDLLGMKALIKGKNHGNENEAIGIIQNIRDIVKAETKYFRRKSGGEPTTQLFISDSFIFVCDSEYLIPLMQLLAVVQMRILVECKFLLRGAMTLGEVIVTDDGTHIIGPGYIDAYLMQEENAIYPRIIMHKSIIQKIGTHYCDVLVFDDNEYCIDYLGYCMKTEQINSSVMSVKLKKEELFDVLLERYNTFKANDSYSVKQKYGWTIKYFENKGVWPSDKSYYYE